MSETTAKVMKKKPMMKGGKGKMRHMMFEPVDNKGGAISTMVHEPAGGDEDRYQPPVETKAIHPTMAHMVKHLKANMAESFPAKAAPAAGGDTDGGPADAGDDDAD